MAIRKDVVSLAVCALLAGAGFAKAQDGASATAKASYLTLNPSALTLDAAPQRAPLMAGLDKIGLAKPLDNLGINIYGFIDGGYTHNFNNVYPIPGRTFTSEIGNHLQLDQVDLSVERVVDRKKLDVGGKIEWTYGTDSRFIHANGLNFYSSSFDADPQYQFDPTQFYVDVSIPVGNGLLIRGGKFVTLLGYEYINPTLNAFYSHTYEFNDGINFTDFGGYASYNVTADGSLTVTGGVIRGWDQAFKDNNGDVSEIAQVTYAPNKQWNFTLNGSFGPENPGNDSNYRTFVEGIANWAPNDSWTFGFDAFYGDDGARDANGGDAQWYGGAVYAGYALNKYITVNGRAEVYYDGDGVTTGYGATTPTGNNDITLTDGTLGLSIKPFPDSALGQGLRLRPEVRYDWADRSGFFTSTSRQDQVTIGMDVIYAF